MLLRKESPEIYKYSLYVKFKGSLMLRQVVLIENTVLLRVKCSIRIHDITPSSRDQLI
jgi:hypothetical protein